jgi:flagellar biosynthesis GTPase FlhF
MKGILSFLAGLASAFGIAWLYKNNQEFRQTVDNAREQVREQAQSAGENFSEAAQSASEKVKSKTSAAADAARRAVFTRATSRSKSSEKRSTESNNEPSGTNLNACSREDLVRLGLTDDLADKVIENRPYRNKLDLVSRLVILQPDYDNIKHSIFVDDSSATDSVNVAS